MKNLESLFDDIDREKMSREFAIALHNALGSLMTNAMKSQEDVAPAAILITTGGIGVIGEGQTLVALIIEALKSPDFRALHEKALMLAMFNELSELDQG